MKSIKIIVIDERDSFIICEVDEGGFAAKYTDGKWYYHDEDLSNVIAKVKAFEQSQKTSNQPRVGRKQTSFVEDLFHTATGGLFEKR